LSHGVSIEDHDERDDITHILAHAVASENDAILEQILDAYEDVSGSFPEGAYIGALHNAATKYVHPSTTRAAKKYYKEAAEKVIDTASSYLGQQQVMVIFGEVNGWLESDEEFAAAEMIDKLSRRT